MPAPILDKTYYNTHYVDNTRENLPPRWFHSLSSKIPESLSILLHSHNIAVVKQKHVKSHCRSGSWSARSEKTGTPPKPYDSRPKTSGAISDTRDPSTNKPTRLSLNEQASKAQ